MWEQSRNGPDKAITWKYWFIEEKKSSCTCHKLVQPLAKCLQTWKSINVLHHINRMQGEKHVISSDAGKAFDKIQLPLIIKRSFSSICSNSPTTPLFARFFLNFTIFMMSTIFFLLFFFCLSKVINKLLHTKVLIISELFSL